MKGQSSKIRQFLCDQMVDFCRPVTFQTVKQLYYSYIVLVCRNVESNCVSV